MASAAICVCFFLALIIFTLIFLNYQLSIDAWCANDTNLVLVLRCAREDKVEDALDENVEGEMGTRMFTRFRVLIGTKASNLRRPRQKRDNYAPAPAPSIVTALVASAPLLRARVFSRSPSHHQHHLHHIEPVHSSVHANRNAENTRHERVIAAVVASVGATMIILGVALILLCKRSSRARKKSRKVMPQSIRRSKFQAISGVTNKVSFDPGPELNNLSSLTTYLESDLRLDQKSMTVNVLPNENICSYQSHSAELHRLESEMLNSPDKQSLSGDDSHSEHESFHSVCCSYSSNQSVSDALEESINHLTANSSPFYSSYKSYSPNHETSVASPINLPAPSTSGIKSAIFLSLKSSENGAFQASSSSQIQSIGSLPSTECSTLFAGLKKSTPQASNRYSLNLEMGSYKPTNSSLKQELVSAAKVAYIEPISSPQEKSISSDITRKGMQSASMPQAINGDILTPSLPPLPPPPPPPTNRTSSYSKGLNSCKPPPPPLPCRQQVFGKDGAPLRKLKPLHWDKVRARPDRSMVWDRIRSNSFEFDEKMIETLFSYNLQNSSTSEALNVKNPSSSKHVMEHKRLQNITILMKALNATTSIVCDALLQARGLTVQQLEALVKMAPNKEEKERLLNYEGNVNDLDTAENFLKEVIKIPHAFARIEAMLFKETFRDEAAHLTSSFQMLEEACRELKSSRLFLRLLEAVLKTGNRMNVGTIRGDAKAFKLDALLKLADIKGTDGKTTLLHFVVQEMIRLEGEKAIEMAKLMTKENYNRKFIEEKEYDCRSMGLKLVLGLTNELCNVKKTASIDLDNLISSVSNLSHGMAQLKNLIEELSCDGTNETFVKTIETFINTAEKNITELKDNENQVLAHVREISEYYHGDISKDEGNPLRIFVIVRDFLAMLDRACKEIKSSKSYYGPFPVTPFR